MFDIVATVASFILALALRFDVPSQRFDDYLSTYGWVIPLLVGFRLSSFIWLRLYQRVWRYASVDELVAVAIAALSSSTLAYLLVFVTIAVVPMSLPFPRSIPIIDTVLVLFLAGSWRFGLRIVGVGRAPGNHAASDQRAVVVGAGPAAIGVLRELRHGDLSFNAIGVIAEDLSIGQRLMGVPVLGHPDDLGAVLAKNSVDVVLLALPSAEGRTIRKLVRVAQDAGATCLTVPSVSEVVSGRVKISSVRELRVDDLLRRAPTRIDLTSVSESFQDSDILITGAGGSIGSELARQLITLSPRRLYLLGRGENSIFEVLQTLPDAQRTLVTPIIADIRDDERIRRIFTETNPRVVFHAAAHKHVAFMELYPDEAIMSNVLGTAHLLEASEISGVERFVLISSDKAVNPSSVMGVTKRIAELLVVSAAARTGRRFANVRFGNVLSSRGSVVPLFQKQLERGGPITITHEDATRYFMTIPEAVQLVLQASAYADPGDTFVLDMGVPVRIVDLARDLARLHGAELGEDIEVKVIGLRQGEKLTEELFFEHEHPEPTNHPSIRRVVPAKATVNLDAALLELRRLVDMGETRALTAAMNRVVPEYQPSEPLQHPTRDG